MKIIRQILTAAAVIVAVPAALADSDRDCLLKGTVVHGDGAGLDNTTVKIHSVRPYEDDARCRELQQPKMRFKLPADSRLEEAPSGSAVEYRYRLDDRGESDAELISIGA
ncbi:MAG: hypothetical protein U5K56_20055 [Halioglobus sp.]|nr:hypothetical protein [Halioglobus sp.]